MIFYDFLLYFYIFMYIYNHHSTGSFLPVSSNRSSKDSDPPSADQDQPCFCMLFCSVDHSVYDLSTGSGQYSYIPCCACVLLSISKRNEPDASCISLCYADCMLSWFSFLCYLSYIRCHPHGQSTEFYPESMIAQLIFLVFADIILYKPARKYLGWMVTNFHNAFVWRIACIFPCCFTFLVFTYIPHNYYDIYTYHDLHVYFSMMLTLLVFVFLLYVLFYTIIHSYVENQYILEEQKILEIQAKEYSQLSQHVQETREIRHDFRHQITVISGLLNQGNYEELKEYLSQYESSISLQTKIYCRQPAVNAILSHYDLLCAQAKIKTKFAVDFPTLSPISSVDFCIVLGNLLENAYLECKTLQKYEKFIHLKARQTSPGAFVLLIENPYEHEIKKTDSGFFLSSRRKNCVGTGLKSVTAICKKYDGHLSIETDNHRFKVKMFLQC